MERLKDYLGPYQGLNDDTIKRLYFPTVVFVKDGQIQMFHEGTIPSQDDPYVKLTDDQEDELENILITGVKKVQGILCTDDTKC